jgi:hypothetical protein
VRPASENRPLASRGSDPTLRTPTLRKPRPVRHSGLRLSPGRWSAGQQGNHPAGLRARLYEVPLRRGADGGVQGSGTGGAGAQAGTVGTPAVIFVAEDCLLSAVSPLGDVMWQTRDDDTCQPGQAGSLSVAGRPVSNYVWCPLNSAAGPVTEGQANPDQVREAHTSRRSTSGSSRAKSRWLGQACRAASRSAPDQSRASLESAS